MQQQAIAYEVATENLAMRVELELARGEKECLARRVALMRSWLIAAVAVAFVFAIATGIVLGVAAI